MKARPASAAPGLASSRYNSAMSQAVTDGASRGVTTPPGRIRAARNRVRPNSPGFRDIGFFSTHTPEHLTSPSRRPVSAVKPATMATHRVEKHISLKHSSSGPALDVSMISEQQNKMTYRSVVSLSNRSKQDLRKLLDEGLRLLTELPTEMAVEICAAASSDQHRNPLSSVMCDSFRSVQLTGASNVHREERQRVEEKNLMMKSLSILVTQGAELLERVDQNMVSRMTNVRMHSFTLCNLRSN